MGRPIKKKWFTARDVAGWTGDLTVTTTAGDEAIIKQVGTGVYEVASGRVKLKDAAPVVAAGPGVVGDAQLAFAPTAGGGGNVWKVNQYRMYFFDELEGSAQWRDGADPAVIEGVLTPALTPEGGAPPVGTTATATATAANGLVSGYTVTDGGTLYVGAPAVTVSAPDGTSAAIGAIVVDEGTGVNDPGTITSIAVANGGSGYSSVPAVTITGTNTGAASATAVVTNGVVTAITVDTAGTGYGIADVAVTIDAVVTVQETATATEAGGIVTAIASDGNGLGYVAATVTVAAP